jgi:outer membrane scaffolding protein for murein synthesis (MipA/OmpV family)
MSEEQAGGGTSIKNILIGLVSTVTLGVGGWFTTKLTGGDEKEAAPAAAAPVINITNSNQQAQQAGGGKTVVIKEKETVKEPAKPVKKKDGDEFKEEAPKW